MKKPKPIAPPTFKIEDIPSSVVSTDLPILFKTQSNCLCRWAKKYANFPKLITIEHPSYRTGTGKSMQYCTIEVCLFILTLKNSAGSDITKTYARSILKTLGYYEGKCYIKPSDKKIETHEKENELKRLKSLKLPTGAGIEEALNRARAIEQYMAQGVQENVLDPEMYAITLKQWQEALELLRKLESDALKVMEQQKTLVRLDEAIRIYNKGISSAQSKLRLMANNLCQDLIGLDIIQMKVVMEKAIDRALEGIANVWQIEEKEESQIEEG